MKYTVEEIEKIITDNSNDFRKHASDELKEIEAQTGKKYPEIAYFMFRFEDRKTFRVEICISPDALKTPEKIHWWAEYIFACMGGERKES